MTTAVTPNDAYSNNIIIVTNSTELAAALKTLSDGSGGTIQVDPAGGPYEIDAYGMGSESSPILIEPLGTESPEFLSISLNGCSDIALTGMTVDTSSIDGRAIWEPDLSVTSSSNIEIVGNTFIGSAEGYLSEGTATSAPSGSQGNTGADIRDSDNVLVADNLFTNYFYGVKLNDVTNVNFTGNEITQIQGDGLHCGGIQNVTITDNYMHSFLGSTQTLCHSDMIQIRCQSTDLVNMNIEISGNLLDSSDGAASQGIHIRNETFGDGTETGGYMYDISIFDNVIHNALGRGIGVDDVSGLEIYDNTVLWNTASTIQTSPETDPYSMDPRIVVKNSPDAQVSGNIAGTIRIDGDLYPDGGYMLDYTNSSADNYFGNHIVNLDGSGDPLSYDLSIRPDSELWGLFGAAASSVTENFEVADGTRESDPMIDDGATVEGTPSGDEIIDEVIEEETTYPIEEPGSEEPVTQDPVVEEPMVEEPVLDETATDLPTNQEPAATGDDSVLKKLLKFMSRGPNKDSHDDVPSLPHGQLKKLEDPNLLEQETELSDVVPITGTADDTETYAVDGTTEPLDDELAA